jgi:ABC-type sugar transport system permease subunit
MVWKQKRAGYGFILPALLVLFFIGLYPLLYQIYLSFTDWYLLRSPEPIFHGLAGFERLLNDEVVWESLGRTLIWTIGTVIIEFLLGLTIALLLNRPSRLNGILSGLILLPWVAPSIVIALTWRWLLDSEYGTIHYVLHELGLVGRRSLLGSPQTALAVLTFISAWKGTPFMVVALLAAMKSIPQELYESASVDGATAFDRLRFITLPLIRRTAVVMSLVLGILAFYSFDIVWAIGKGGPVDSTTLIGVYLFRNFFERKEISYAATIAVGMMIFLLFFSMLYLLAFREHRR